MIVKIKIFSILAKENSAIIDINKYSFHLNLLLMPSLSLKHLDLQCRKICVYKLEVQFFGEFVSFFVRLRHGFKFFSLI